MPPPAPTRPETLYGEIATARIQPSSIPLSAGWDETRLQQLKAGDDDPLEISATVAPGKGSNGTYAESAVRRFVDAVREHTLAGYLGHTKPADFPFEFRLPAVHWVGATWSDGKGVFRGVVDKTAAEIKRLIRVGRIDGISIYYGDAKRERRGNETVITDVVPVSIDLTPYGRQGMATAGIEGFETEHQHQEGGDMPTRAELLTALREERITVPEVLGEMGWTAAEMLPHLKTTLPDAAAILDRDGWSALAAEHEAMATIRGKLYPGIAADKPAGEVASAVAELVGELATLRQRDRSTSLERALGRADPAIPDFARPFVLDAFTEAAGELRSFEDGELDKALGKILEQDRIKALVGARPAASAAGIHVQESNRQTGGQQNGGLKPRWSSI